MTELSVTLQEKVSFPDGSTIEYAVTGNVSGVRLKDGRLVKPWICYEIEEDDGSTHDLRQDEMTALDIDAGLDLIRRIEEI